jgi:hypothetical protein
MKTETNNTVGYYMTTKSGRKAKRPDVWDDQTNTTRLVPDELLPAYEVAMKLNRIAATFEDFFKPYEGDEYADTLATAGRILTPVTKDFMNLMTTFGYRFGHGIDYSGLVRIQKWLDSTATSEAAARLPETATLKLKFGRFNDRGSYVPMLRKSSK